MATLNSVRSTVDEDATTALAIFIEGIPYIWCTDHPGDVLLGSGGSSWIGSYETEAAYSAHEQTGQRIVVGGLRWPTQLQRGKLNPNDGMLESTAATIEILDFDGIIPGLLASADKDPEILAQRVAPGTTAVTATLDVEQAPGTIDPASMYLGIERLGPARQRRWMYCHPWQGIGLHHHQHAEAAIEGGPPLVPVTTQPLVWAGREVSIYRLYRDPDGNPDSYTSWYHWGQQYAAGNLEWHGVLQDRGEFDGVKWSLRCFGPESRTRRKLGTIDCGWMQVNSAANTIPEEHRGAAVTFRLMQADGDITTFDSVGFGSVSGGGTLPSSGSGDDYADAVGTFVQEVADGTITADYGTLGPFLDYDMSDPPNGIGDTGVSFQRDVVQISRASHLGSGDGVTGLVYMEICLHETIWRRIGWEPDVQTIGMTDTPETLHQIIGRKIASGDYYTGGGADAAKETPGPGYWTLVFTSVELGFPAFGQLAQDNFDNGGAPRAYKPLHNAAPVILSTGAGDTFTVGESYPYLEGDPTVAET